MTTKSKKAARIIETLAAYADQTIRVEAEVLTNYANGEQFERISVYSITAWDQDKRIITADLYDSGATLENLETEAPYE